MNNVEILKEYEMKRNKLWAEKHELEIRRIHVCDNISKTELEAFIKPVNNYNDDVCLCGIANESDFIIVSSEEFNSKKYTIINSKELLCII